MDIERIWTANAGRNFNYLVACPEAREALAIDPLAHEACLAAAERRGWRITQIVNTHEHGDHTGGNEPLRAATGARLLAHAGNLGRISGVDRGLSGGDIIEVGTTVTLEVLDTPGHTLAHVCLYADADPPALFSGDTLFNAGAGNCHLGGHPGQLFETFTGVIEAIPGATRVYPGHEYLARNLAFTLDREPGNARARELLMEVETHDPATARVTTLAFEKEINTFLRLGSSEVIAGLRAIVPEFPTVPTPRDVFLSLRELRNCW
jgi:hydroxyacylglutathione hydrolase